MYIENIENITIEQPAYCLHAAVLIYLMWTRVGGAPFSGSKVNKISLNDNLQF